MLISIHWVPVIKSSVTASTLLQRVTSLHFTLLLSSVIVISGRSKTGADRGFPVGGGANPPMGANIYDFAKFCEKLHEIEKILGRGGGGLHAGGGITARFPRWGDTNPKGGEAPTYYVGQFFLKTA